MAKKEKFDEKKDLPERDHKLLAHETLVPRELMEEDIESKGTPLKGK